MEFVRRQQRTTGGGAVIREFPRAQEAATQTDAPTPRHREPDRRTVEVGKREPNRAAGGEGSRHPDATDRGEGTSHREKGRGGENATSVPLQTPRTEGHGAAKTTGSDRFTAPHSLLELQGGGAPLQSMPVAER